MKTRDWANILLMRLAMAASPSILALGLGPLAHAQQIAPPAAIPVEGTPLAPEGAVPVPTTAVTGINISNYDPSQIATVASTSGISGTSVGQVTYRNYAQTVGRAVNDNAFLPTDNISDSPVVIIPSLRLNGLWDVSAVVSTAINYDSNITRSSVGEPSFDDFYEHTTGALSFRLGTAATPLEMQVNYAYSADVFTRYTDFDTYTHNLNFNSRIGRSNVKWFPYFSGSFRSVQNPAALSAGRETYDYLEEGLRGEEDIFPTLVHTYDFSHTSVDYGQRIGDNFQIWRLYQELSFKFFTRTAPSRFPTPAEDLSVFPWLEMKETAPQNFAGTNELNGGLGARMRLNDKLAVEARGGWGGVQSNDPSVSNGSFSGPRYDASIDYRPADQLRVRLSYDRLLSFSPTAVGRDVNVLDAVIESPWQLDSHFTAIAAIEVYRADSNDYQVFEHAFFPQPSLQLTYQMNDHLAAFFKTQYRETNDYVFGFDNKVKVLQTTLGLTGAF